MGELNFRQKVNKFLKENLFTFIITSVLAGVFAVYGIIQYNMFNNYNEILSNQKLIFDKLNSINDYLKTGAPDKALIEWRLEQLEKRGNGG